jgi:hypothetical protein
VKKRKYGTNSVSPALQNSDFLPLRLCNERKYVSMQNKTITIGQQWMPTIHENHL